MVEREALFLADFCGADLAVAGYTVHGSAGRLLLPKFRPWMVGAVVQVSVADYRKSTLPLPEFDPVRLRGEPVSRRSIVAATRQVGRSC